jgi:hypothetical protein
MEKFCYVLNTFYHNEALIINFLYTISISTRLLVKINTFIYFYKDNLQFFISKANMKVN